jgi:hypothetical protein
MSYDDRARAAQLANDSDAEEDALVNDYREQVNFDDGMSELDRTTSLGAQSAAASVTQDLQAQLAAAATPLEYKATLETKFASYDNYCSLFHYILNSDGPVDLEVPSVSFPFLGLGLIFFVWIGEGRVISWLIDYDGSITGRGMLSMSSFTSSSPFAGTAHA